MENNMINANLNSMTAKIAQRERLMNSELTHEEKIAAALTQNRKLTHEELSLEMAQVQQLTVQAEGRIQSYIANGAESLREKMKEMSRSECIIEMTGVLKQIHAWNRGRKHEDLTLSDDVREQLAYVYDCFSRNEEPNLTKDEVIDLTIDLARQCTMITVAENMADVDSEAVIPDLELLTDEETLQHRALMIAIAMNLKKTGKLSDKLQNVSDEDLATVVCGMDAVHGYCAMAAKSSLTPKEFVGIVGNLLLGLGYLLISCYSVLAAIVLPGVLGILPGILGIIGFVLCATEFMTGIYRFYKSLFPAGISETRPVVAVKNFVQNMISFAGRLIRSAVRVVENLVSKLFACFSSLAGKAVRCTANAMQKVSTQVNNYARAKA